MKQTSPIFDWAWQAVSEAWGIDPEFLGFSGDTPAVHARWQMASMLNETHCATRDEISSAIGVSRPALFRGAQKLETLATTDTDLAAKCKRASDLFVSYRRARAETGHSAVAGTQTRESCVSTRSDASLSNVRRNEGSKEWARLAYVTKDRIDPEALRNWQFEDRVAQAKVALRQGIPEREVRKQVSWFVFREAVTQMGAAL
jgi:hypothetical protein